MIAVSKRGSIFVTLCPTALLDWNGCLNKVPNHCCVCSEACVASFCSRRKAAGRQNQPNGDTAQKDSSEKVFRPPPHGPVVVLRPSTEYSDNRWGERAVALTKTSSKSTEHRSCAGGPGPNKDPPQKELEQEGGGDG